MDTIEGGKWLPHQEIRLDAGELKEPPGGEPSGSCRAE